MRLNRLPAVEAFCGALILVHGASARTAQESVAPDQPGQISVSWRADAAVSNKFTVEVLGIKSSDLDALRQAHWTQSQWQDLLIVRVEPEKPQYARALPAMSGTYDATADSLRFIPAFPLTPGVKCSARFDPAHLPGPDGVAGRGVVNAWLQVPSPQSAPTTVVTEVYPSAPVLPENLLKFYLHFSAPMSRGHIYNYIHLLGDSGKEVELPFLEINEELWSPDLTRLTLFIDPGRIKRGVRPLEEVGPALQEGRFYKLVIDSAWQDGAGVRLRDGFEKRFKVGPPDRSPPDPASWKIQPVTSGNRSELIVTFPKPMDHALAQRLIQVTDVSARPVRGTSTLRDQEREWVFKPDSPWPRGTYRLIVQTTIEDLAGNNIGKPFEVDLFEGVEQNLKNASVQLEFQAN